MKKHEACYYLNKIIQDKRESLRYSREKNPTTESVDPTTGERKPLSEAELKENEKWQTAYQTSLEMEIEALDIAAASLTK